MIDKGGEKGKVGVWNQQRCRAGSACFQSLCVTVDLIIQFPDGFLDADSVGFPYRKTVHDFRYGAQRDTGFFCHIFHCRGRICFFHYNRPDLSVKLSGTMKIS